MVQSEEGLPSLPPAVFHLLKPPFKKTMLIMGVESRSGLPIRLISQTTIAENHAQGAGGGINISSYASPVFTNITVYNNKADWAGGGMYRLTPHWSVISHATFYNNASPIRQ